MYLYFNNKGQLLEKLEHGPVARAGTTNYEIFAYFDNLNIDTLYTEAELKLIKPDFNNTKYPAIPMERAQVIFHKQEGENPLFFEDGKLYKGFYFNFGVFEEDDEPLSLLDTSGIWNSYINLRGSNHTNYVQGTSTITVQSGIEDEDGVTLELDQLLNRIYEAISQRIPLDSDGYFRVIDDITPFEPFNVGDIVFSKSKKKIYRIIDREGHLENIPFEFTDLIVEGILNLNSIDNIVFNSEEHLVTLERCEELFALKEDAITVENQDYIIPEGDR